MIKNTDLRKKEFKYRGKTIEELNNLNLREFIDLLKSNEKRSALRQINELQKFILKCKKKNGQNKTIKTHLRHLIITPEIIGLKIKIYNGKIFFQIEISKEMLGHRLGEFSVTRTKVKHGAAGVGATRSSSFLSVK